MTTPTVIVYRNPLEEMIWSGLMSGALAPLFVSLLIGVVVSAIVGQIFRGKRVWGRSTDDLSVQSFFAAFFISICVLYFL